MNTMHGWCGLVMVVGTVLLGGCGGLSGEYGGEGCPFELDFRGGGKVHVTFLGMETQGTYEVDGDKVTVRGEDAPLAVFTRRGDRLEANVLGATVVCPRRQG